MARTALTTAWSTLGTAVTGAFAQNFSSTPILVAFAASAPAAAASVGYLLQPGDFVPVTGLTSTNCYARTLSGTGSVEADTVA